MARLKIKTTIKTTDGEPIVIKEELGEGGQGIVYKVEYQNALYALKWYFKGVGANSKKFYRNLKENISRCAPAKTFLWPIAITEIDENNCFGYVMGLRPSEYEDFDAILLSRVQFKSFSALANAALQFAASFRALHSKGLCYQDLNDGNFFINPETGDVLICDNDNVAPEKQNFGIQGKPKYMAPEIVLLNKMPDIASDKFSLAVVLFMLFFHDHPLFGRKNNNKIDPAKNDMNLYCNNPIFIFDPKDDSNRPDPEVNRAVVMLWPLFPPSIRYLFIKAFDKSLMKNDGGAERDDRIMDNEWIKSFAKFRTQIITSPICGEETFFEYDDDEHICMNTDKKFDPPPLLKVRDFVIPLQPGRKIYLYEISDVDIDIEQINNIVGEVVANKNNPKIWGLKNLSGKQWVKITPTGKKEPVENGKVVPVAQKIKIQFPSNVEGMIE